jgi:hypothetical protein
VRLWKWVSVSIGASLLGNMEGCSFPRAFEKRENFLHLGNFYEEFERYVKRPCKCAALSIGALLQNLEEVCLLEPLREKESVYLGSFSWTPEDIKS